MRVSRGAGDATVMAASAEDVLGRRIRPNPEGRRTLEPRRQNRTHHPISNTPSRQMHIASAFEQRRARATHIRITPCSEEVQNERVASRAPRRAEHHDKKLAHRENKNAQSSNACFERTGAARRSGDAKHACTRHARCCRFDPNDASEAVQRLDSLKENLYNIFSRPGSGIIGILQLNIQ